MTDLRALLAPIRERLAAATPGPWFREYGDVITTDPDPRDVEEGYDDPRSLRVVRAAPHLAKREPQGIRNADFIANAPMDLSRLLAAIEAVTTTLDQIEEETGHLGLNLQDDDFDRGWYGARRDAIDQTRTALAAALGSDTTNQEGTQ